MSIVDDLLGADVDIGAAVTEDELNKFAVAHHEVVPSLYVGSHDFDDFPDRLRVGYNIANPLKFDLSPIPDHRFIALWRKYLKKKGASDQALAKAVADVPNLRLKTSGAVFTFTVFVGHTNTEQFSVSFDWDVEAVCAVSIVAPSPNVYSLRLAAVTMRFSKHTDELLRDVSHALSRARERSNQLSVEHRRWLTEAKGDPEQLVLFFVNQLLAMQLTNFINELPLPNAVQLFDQYKLRPSFLEIRDHTLVLGGQIFKDLEENFDCSYRVRALLAEYRERAQREMATITDGELANWSEARSDAARWLVQRANEMVGDREEEAVQIAAEVAYPQNLAVYIRDRVLNMAAQDYLSAHVRHDDSAQIDSIVKAGFWWSYDVDHGTARLVPPDGVEVTAHVVADGGVYFCYPSLDPKHFLQWQCANFCIEISPYPASTFDIVANIQVGPSGIYLRLDLKNTGLAITPCDWPDWAKDIVGWITAQFTGPLFTAIRVLIQMFPFKLLSFPKQFPGTPLYWDPRLNSPAIQSGYLVFSGDPNFLTHMIAEGTPMPLTGEQVENHFNAYLRQKTAVACGQEFTVTVENTIDVASCATTPTTAEQQKMWNGLRHKAERAARPTCEGLSQCPNPSIVSIAKPGPNDQSCKDGKWWLRATLTVKCIPDSD